VESSISSVSVNIIVVLHQPRNVVNIGGVVRAMKNMGLHRLRLVEPVPFTKDDIERVAHRSADILAAIRVYDDLDEALADTIYVVGTTEHLHGQHTIQHNIYTFAPEIVQRSRYGPVALLFGSEANGLDTRALDRCHVVVRLPTDPSYPSLNLAQAALLLMYELRRSIDGEPIVPSVNQQPATTAQLETLFATWEDALRAVEFFKTPDTSSIVRQFRAVIHRADLDQRQAALFMAIAREIVHYMRRTGRHTEADE
jgi:TrmH family RNA methyltransferase